jgi:hypothetical protein
VGSDDPTPQNFFSSLASPLYSFRSIYNVPIFRYSAFSGVPHFPPSPMNSTGKPDKEPIMPARPERKKSQNHSTQKSKTKHPIRVVPLHPAVRDATAAAPVLTYRDGPLLTNVEVFTVFWGAAWQDAANSALTKQLNDFYDFVLTSSLLDQLAEYSVPGKKIGHGVLTGTATVTNSEPGKTVDDSAIQSMVQTEISAGTLPASNANSLYFVYLPPGTQVTSSGSASCKDFCGYHDATSSGIYYAVMPYPGCTGCQGGLATLDALTSTSSHELCEAITDPVPGQGWYDDNNGEIGDICAWKTKKLDTYTVQLEWSNSANSCI